MKSVVKKEIRRFTGVTYRSFFDDVIVEEPLELFENDSNASFLVTMRTPGNDVDLTVGLLFSMGVIQEFTDIISTKHFASNKLRIYFKNHISVKEKNVITNSSCGLCNSTSWEEISLHSYFPIFDKTIRILSSVIADAHTSLINSEDDFSFTGGNHKVILIDFNGSLKVSAEDVGRHNAFDKVLGQCVIEQSLPLKSFMVVLSGRCSYEMCQKAWQGGIPIIIARGAPTSKAIELAEAAGITLIGFARSSSFNVYTHPYRIEYEKK